MITQELEKILKKAVLKATKKRLGNVFLSKPDEKSFGDFSTNAALMLAKDVHEPPQILAKKILDAFPENDLFSKTDIAGPGFINFWLSDKAYEQCFLELNKKIIQKTFGKLTMGKGKTAITDTSNPNVAKPMGVHHLLSTIIGQTINNLLKIAGYKVIKDNYIGDWGTQFGKLIVAIRKWGNMNRIQKNPIPEFLTLYVKFHEEVEKTPDLDDEARKEFKKLEDGDVDNKKLWEWIRLISLTDFQKIWNRLGVEFDMIHGEGYYQNKMSPLIDEGMKKGVIVPGETGSFIVPMDDLNMPPVIIRKSDGSTTYHTRDLARIKDWNDTYHGDIGIVVCDIAQKLHHDQLEVAANKLELSTMKNIRVLFGRMNFPDKEMSTRKGNVVLLEDVMDEAEKKAYEKIELHKSELPEPEKRELARKIGIGAIKYNILSQNRMKNYTFVWGQMLSFEGNSAPYLQYAYTRTQSILRKAQDEKRDPAKTGTLAPDLKDEEKSLLKKLMDFPESIWQSMEQWKPNLLCTYLFELAQEFSHFYNNLRVLNAETKDKQYARLALVRAIAYVLKTGLTILGIEVPDRM